MGYYIRILSPSAHPTLAEGFNDLFQSPVG